MLRRSISLVLLFGFVASQLAAIPHAHESGRGADHDVHPHVHLTWFCHDHDHETGDDHQGQEPAPGRSIGADRNHDSDAVYCSSDPLDNQRGGGSFSDARESVVATQCPIVLPGCLVGDQPSLIASDALHPRAPNCALYLTLRALRI